MPDKTGETHNSGVSQTVNVPAEGIFLVRDGKVICLDDDSFMTYLGHLGKTDNTTHAAHAILDIIREWYEGIQNGRELGADDLLEALEFEGYKPMERGTNV